MSYQLVLQFPAPSDSGFDTMISLENDLTEHLADDADVDGHDWGCGEFNIFIWTADPARAFEIIKGVPSVQASLGRMRAAYRAEESDDYVVLHPPGLAEFSVS